jgi:hypothetical protein
MEEVPHNYSRRSPKRLKVLQETGQTRIQGIVWFGLSLLKQAACSLLWCFCLRTLLRGIDISALRTHTLKPKECLSALGTLLLVVCTFAAYLNPNRLCRDGLNQPNSREPIFGSLLPRSFPSSSRSVELAVKYTTVPGENLFVVGSAVELGTWNVGRSVPMQWADGNVWTAKVNILPSTKRVEYKYVVRSDRETLNHVLEVDNAAPPNRLDIWGIA